MRDLDFGVDDDHIGRQLSSHRGQAIILGNRSGEGSSTIINEQVMAPPRSDNSTTAPVIGLANNGHERLIAGGIANSSKPEFTNDPFRLYLREIGDVDLLSREGEIAHLSEAE